MFDHLLLSPSIAGRLFRCRCRSACAEAGRRPVIMRRPGSYSISAPSVRSRGA